MTKPAIIKYFRLKLTAKQGIELRKIWSGVNEAGGAMIIAQPISTWGPFHVKYPDLNFAVLDSKLSHAISSAINKHKKSRPA